MEEIIKPASIFCSVVIPVFNEEDNIARLYARLTEVLTTAAERFEIIFVDDGSMDRSLEAIKDISSSDERVFYLSFTRNFGHESASTAGLDAARGDCVILMDADLQDPPELIPEMIEQWSRGHQLVYARRRKRHGESFFKRATAGVFYRMLNLLSEAKIPMDTGDFRLMDAAVVRDFRKCREQNRFVRGLTAWTGYNQAALEFDRPARNAGETKYNALKLFLLSLDVITSFSIIPLRLVTIVGFAIALLSVGKTIHIIIQRLFLDLNIPGYALLASGLFFLGGVQIFFLGIIGEYIGRIYRQVQQRPLYLVKEDNFSKQ